MLKQKEFDELLLASSQLFMADRDLNAVIDPINDKSSEELVRDLDSIEYQLMHIVMKIKETKAKLED